MKRPGVTASIVVSLTALVLAATGGAYAAITTSSSTPVVCVRHRDHTLYAAFRCAQGDQRLNLTARPTGPAGGDLTGNYPNPRVITIQGVRPLTVESPAGGDIQGNFRNLKIAAPPGPTALTLNNIGSDVWTSPGGGYSNLSCYEDREGLVHLQGAAEQGATSNGVAVVSSLPTGCPPPAARRGYMIPVATASFSAVDPGNLRVESTGALLVQDGGSAVPPDDVVTFDGVTWRAGG